MNSQLLIQLLVNGLVVGTLYGVVALEVFGHMDPRVIASGDMFVHVVREFAPKIGLADDADRLERLIRDRIARG